MYVWANRQRFRTFPVSAKRNVHPFVTTSALFALKLYTKKQLTDGLKSARNFLRSPLEKVFFDYYETRYSDYLLRGT